MYIECITVCTTFTVNHIQKVGPLHIPGDMGVMEVKYFLKKPLSIYFWPFGDSENGISKIQSYHLVRFLKVFYLAKLLFVFLVPFSLICVINFMCECPVWEVHAIIHACDMI